MDCLKAHAQQLRPFAEARAAELQQLAAIAQRAARDGALPDLDAVPREVLRTGAAAAAALFVLLLPRGRRLVFDTIDTALATALCLLLLALLLSVPVGTVYLAAKGAMLAAAAVADAAAPAVSRLLVKGA